MAIDLDDFDIPFGRSDEGLKLWSLQRSFDLIFNPRGTVLTKVAIGCIFGRSDDGGYVRVGHGFMSLSIKWIRFTRFSTG